MSEWQLLLVLDATHVIYPRISVLEVLFIIGSVSESSEKLEFTYIGPSSRALDALNAKSGNAYAVSCSLVALSGFTPLVNVYVKFG
jgi:hypothetical protein